MKKKKTPYEELLQKIAKEQNMDASNVESILERFFELYFEAIADGELIDLPFSNFLFKIKDFNPNENQNFTISNNESSGLVKINLEEDGAAPDLPAPPVGRKENTGTDWTGFEGKAD